MTVSTKGFLTSFVKTKKYKPYRIARTESISDGVGLKLIFMVYCKACILGHQATLSFNALMDFSMVPLMDISSSMS